MRLTNVLLWLLVAVPFLASAGVSDTAPRPYDITEQRQPCREYHGLRHPYFGDTHVHTKWSLDASTQGTRTSPADAYRFGRGMPLGVQPWTEEGKPSRTLQLDRPLDFAAVTDHAELFGEVSICNTPGMDGYGAWQCLVYRHWPRAAFFLFNMKASSGGGRLGFCGEDGTRCRNAGLGPWQDIQQAAEDAYDRSENCDFTAFVGYEWTGAWKNVANLHRNVIFRNANVPDLPLSFVDAPSQQQLWDGLDKHCLGAVDGCDVLAIPHNSNLSDGNMFRVTRDDRSPLTAENAAQRARLEPLVEVMQHKGSSECYYGPGNRADELCTFEQLSFDKFSGQNSRLLRNPPQADDGFLREVLRDGLALEQSLGVNPFKMGFIASTDTHIAAAGGVEESTFIGHGGAGVPPSDTANVALPDDLEFNPGGLAVLWAEENTRDSLFAAMRRKETYGTSGPRLTVRFFGGRELPPDLCEAGDFAATGYAQGVPMGGDLPAGDGAPRFAIAAMMDSGGKQRVPLQRIQVIKGWIDAEGEKREQVYEVAGDPQSQATVDLKSCEPMGQGFPRLCTVWRDPAFDAAEPAYYYARVLQNPTCRWSQHICVANGVDCDKPDTVPDELQACCSDAHRPVIQERAWTSPIWHRPANVSQAGP